MSDAHSALKRIGPALALLAAILGLLAIAAQPASAQSEIVLYSFTGGADGANPCAALIRDTEGNLYGTTWVGGADGQGTVFEVTPTGTERVLHSFAANADGAEPCAALVRDAEGNLYGTTYLGGFFGGTVFKVAPTGTETVLYSFAGEPDGANPYAALVQDGQGNLDGTTIFGGVSGHGTVFEITPTGAEKVLYSFGGELDGANPYAALVLDGHGNLYGTTYAGGAHGQGTVFEVTKTGTERVLYNFGGTHGANPYAALVRDTQGNLYGTTYAGGAHGQGTVFKLAP